MKKSIPIKNSDISHKSQDKSGTIEEKFIFGNIC
jgi:hypothetical protein